jgi:hypothetical protein
MAGAPNGLVFRTPAVDVSALVIGSGIEESICDLKQGERVHVRARRKENVINGTTAPGGRFTQFHGPWLRFYPHSRYTQFNVWGPTEQASATLAGAGPVEVAQAPGTLLFKTIPAYEWDFASGPFYAPCDGQLKIYGESPTTFLFDLWLTREPVQTGHEQSFTNTRSYMAGGAGTVVCPFPLGADEFQIVGTIPANATMFALLNDDANLGAGASGTSAVALNLSAGFATGRIPTGGARAYLLNRANMGTGSISVVSYLKIG